MERITGKNGQSIFPITICRKDGMDSIVELELLDSEDSIYTFVSKKTTPTLVGRLAPDAIMFMILDRTSVNGTFNAPKTAEILMMGGKLVVRVNLKYASNLSGRVAIFANSQMTLTEQTMAASQELSSTLEAHFFDF